MADLRLETTVVKSRIDALLRTYPELADDGELLAGALEGETDLHSLASRILDAELTAVTISNAIRVRRADLTERFNRYDRQVEAYRELLASLMTAAGIDKLMLTEATISITKPRASVLVYDDDAVPTQLCKIVRQPDKTAILKQLQAGETVPGAGIVTGEPGISIRTK